MSSNLQDEIARLLGQPASIFGGQAPQPPQGQQWPQANDFGISDPSVATPPEDFIASPNPSKPLPSSVRNEGYRRIITDFTYGLGSGLSAASQNPTGRALRTDAGIGAILQQPMVLQKAKEALAQQKQEQDMRKAQMLISILGQQEKAKQDAINAQNIQSDNEAQQARNSETARHNREQENRQSGQAATTLRSKGLMIDPSGNVVPVPREMLGPEELAKIQKDEANTKSLDSLETLRKSQEELNDATAALRKAQADPNSSQFELARQRLEIAKRNSDIAYEGLGLRQQSNDMRAATLEATGGISPDRQKMQANAQSGLRAIEDFRTELKKPGVLTAMAIPGSIGARKARNARNEMVDVLTRLRTGAALNKEEQAFYNDQAPGLIDAIDAAASSGESDVIEYKLKRFEDEFKALAGPNKVNLPNRTPAATPAPTNVIRYDSQGNRIK